ncbi:alpha/beta fold hydrolase [Mycobacterium sp. shizuoka-1]|uniref:alpha/beta fold hydrolase n=1 Tax=Mycobacterium sp. shizuoka-1 TaxID=2039281 RepID=UPI000C067D8B|nr:alpha/beta hydrolase [Mycobacterium sp. shizuoka-1]GAY13407.1 putative hydrolase LipZ [Mycobacterium sp. shizuoka-1]
MLPDSVRQWQAGGRMLSTAAGSVFVRSKPGTGPAVLLLHGFPSSSYDYRDVTQRLGDRAWLTLDFLGFGLSDKPRPHRYSLLEQADIVAAVVADVAPGPVVLLAHDMGTSVATELLARDIAGTLPFELQRAVLTNGSVIIERASLRRSQKILRGPFGPILARLTNERGFVRGFAELFSAQHPLTDDEARAQWALMARDDGQRILHLLCAYLNERVRFAARWHGAVRDWGKPLGFLWATGDPVATTNVLAGLRELRPAAEVIELPGIGHYPQIEVPDEFTAGARRLLQI